MMIKNKILIIIFILILYIFYANSRNDNRVIIIKDVNIIPMDEEKILKKRTVIIKDGKIDSISNSNIIKNSNKSTVIDGKGKYLIPGLIDMHAHIFEKNNLTLWLTPDSWELRLIPSKGTPFIPVLPVPIVRNTRVSASTRTILRT